MAINLPLGGKQQSRALALSAGPRLSVLQSMRDPRRIAWTLSTTRFLQQDRKGSLQDQSGRMSTGIHHWRQPSD